ncbi:MAG: alpha/beta hydrolase family protein [Myxococcota bacterium]
MLRPALHRFTDWAAVTAALNAQLYEDGWGDRRALDALVAEMAEGRLGQETPRLDIRWSPRRGLGRFGHFHSPRARDLAPRTQRGVVNLTRPRGTARPPLCLLLAATGEEGFWFRRVLAEGLARCGIGALMLENPYYGSRRPRGQRGPLLRTVRDQFAMNVATVQEARALLDWAHREGYPALGVSGYSQGGIMAAFAAALTPRPVAVVPRGAGNAASPIFTNAALSRRIQWSVLGREVGSVEAAKKYFEACLEPVEVARYAAPLRPDAAILVSARNDGFVPAAEAEALHRHWPGSTLRWLETSHILGAAHLRPHLHAVVDAFTALDPGLPLRRPNYTLDHNR